MKLSRTTYYTFIFIVLVTLSSTACAATSTCVYNKDLFSDSRYKGNSELSSYVWYSSTKEVKGITNNGEMFSAKYWSCNHYGIHAVFFVGPYPNIDMENINELFMVLARISLDLDQVEIIENFINGKVIAVSSEERLFRIKNTEYSEFYISYSVIDESLVLNIKLYKD